MSIRILLAEDHKIVREGTRQLLEKAADMQIIGEAADGLEAIRLAEELRPDVIVMDVRMPALNGLEATRAIKTKLPGSRILILSAYADDRYVFPLFEAGASGYLLKTSSGIELIEAIRKVYAGETALSPRITDKVVNHLGNHQVYRNEKMQEGLTEREMEVLRAAASGLSTRAIGESLSISPQTVQVHLRNVFGKLSVKSRSEAVALAMARGWISLVVDDEE